MTGSNEYTDEASTSHQNNLVTTLITLNVSGILYTTIKRILLKKTKFFSEPFKDFDYNGNIFID
ncbi:16489_t:CDS:2 [Funneliformis mosseae]|uniref:16489_t:CDS:1 n=1 Tax=Funneliformis mosseae TaxID=27381 RepID=A0A9N9HPM3_FUNMO|nr:16489_t:CDS:2 [Funneliformis mosseae]